MGGLVTTDYIVEYDDSQKVKDEVFKRVLQYFIDNEAFHGEVIHQSDDCIIESTSVLSDIADNIIKFEVFYKE